MKKILSLTLAVLLLLMTLTACGGKSVPDVANTDEATAKSILSANSLIPSIKYIYDDTVEEGNVISTEPAALTTVSENTKITVYISKGPSYLEASDARISWYHLSDKEDKWEFYTPYIEEGVLYIKCDNVTFGCAMTWQDSYNNGTIIGIASVTDSFDKTIPVSAKYQKKSWKANESQSFTLEIPLKDLNTSKPTDMYLRLYTTEDNVRVDFYMTW